MNKYTEDWAPTGVKSVFNLALQEISPTNKRPTTAGAGVQSTANCGFGWRFSFRIELQSASAGVVDEAGNTIESFQVHLSFDPHLIRSAPYGVVTVAVHTQHLIAVTAEKPSTPLKYTLPNGSMATPSLGVYVYPSNAPAPSISFTVTFAATLAITLPHPLEPRMERALEDTLTGAELVDLKFYAFSRKGADGVTHPLPLFAKSSLLQGFSDDLDAREHSNVYFPTKRVV